MSGHIHVNPRAACELILEARSSLSCEATFLPISMNIVTRSSSSWVTALRDRQTDQKQSGWYGDYKRNYYFISQS